MNYKHLTAAVRGAIEALLNEKYTQKEVAEKLGVSESTVSREIKKRGLPVDTLQTLPRVTMNGYGKDANRGRNVCIPNARNILFRNCKQVGVRNR